MFCARKINPVCPVTPLIRRNFTRSIRAQFSTSQFRAMAASLSQIEALRRYTACDISDALLKLKVPNCGYLPDLNLYSPVSTPAQDNGPTIAPASTVLFVPRNASDLSIYPESNIPAGEHYVDLTQPETFVVISQPKGQICAVLGGIMALRMKVCGAKGVVAYGRVRDVEELRETGLFIWAKSTSITGTGAEAKPHAIQIPLDLDGTFVNPGDLVFSDAVNGVVVIPQEKVEAVIEMLPRIVEADDKVKVDVSKGMKVHEAFKLHRR